MEKKIAEYKKNNISEEVTLYGTDQYGQQTLKIRDGRNKKLTSVTYRRVSNNEEAIIQFTGEEHNLANNRTKHFSFSIPENMVDLFLSHLSKPWK